MTLPAGRPLHTTMVPTEGDQHPASKVQSWLWLARSNPPLLSTNLLVILSFSLNILIFLNLILNVLNLTSLFLCYQATSSSSSLLAAPYQLHTYLRNHCTDIVGFRAFQTRTDQTKPYKTMSNQQHLTKFNADNAKSNSCDVMMMLMMMFMTVFKMILWWCCCVKPPSLSSSSSTLWWPKGRRKRKGGLAEIGNCGRVTL